jgi:hypothetical protein
MPIDLDGPPPCPHCAEPVDVIPYADDTAPGWWWRCPACGCEDPEVVDERPTLRSVALGGEGGALVRLLIAEIERMRAPPVQQPASDDESCSHCGWHGPASAMERYLDEGRCPECFTVLVWR